MAKIPQTNRIIVIVSVALIALLGTGLLLISRASTFSVAIEPENGNLSTEVSKISDASASNGSAVAFANKQTTGEINSNNPCPGQAKPAKWNHVVVLMFENKQYSEVINPSKAPYISALASKCGSYANWYDADYKVNGQKEASYYSKPNYATLTSGVPPSVHGMKDDSYSTTSSVDNIINRLIKIGKNTKSYVAGTSCSCAKSNFSGAYHDPMRYYTNLGAQSSSTSTYCNTHDVSIDNFMKDVNANSLPELSFILPTNSQNMHDNAIGNSSTSGDVWAQNFLTPLFDSQAYKNGDLAVFFLWDEDTPLPNVLIAPSVKPGSHPSLASGSFPISHYSALKTWQEMLAVPQPFVGDSGQAPSLLNYYNGGN